MEPNHSCTRALVIDDDEDIATLVMTALGRNGMDVYTAFDGPEGLQLFVRLQPDVVILDVMMPKMDGWTVMNRLRELSNVPVVMLTVRADPASHKHARDLGVADYITKPFLPSDLVSRVSAVTAGHPI